MGAKGLMKDEKMGSENDLNSDCATRRNDVNARRNHRGKWRGDAGGTRGGIVGNESQRVSDKTILPSALASGFSAKHHFSLNRNTARVRHDGFDG